MLWLQDVSGRKSPFTRAMSALPKTGVCVPGEMGSHLGILKKDLHHICLLQNKYGCCMEEGLMGGQPERSLSRNLCEKGWHGCSRTRRSRRLIDQAIYI